MANELRFDGKVVIITGAGNGLGRSHALLFASRGARVVVNDLGGSHTGDGKSEGAADKVVSEIKAAGGEAVASYDSVEDGAKIVQAAMDTWKRVDVVVNNAGILRDTSFAKMTKDDWDLVYRVHVLGAFRVTHAAFPYMRDQGYGRVIVTASAAGIYGNFGQANYAMAKLGLVGFSNTLAVEGRKKNVLVNAIAPIAGSRMTETVLPKELLDALRPEYVSPLVAWLCHESCEETGGLFEVGGGFFAKLRWERAQGETLRLGRAMTPETVRDRWGAIAGFEKSTHPRDITSSMQPIMANVQAGPSRGGNDLIDVDRALGYEYPPATSSYDERDLAIYALGVGAGSDPMDAKDLQLVYELHGDGFRALPTFAVIPSQRVMMAQAKEGKSAPGLNYGFDRVLHGEQYTEIKRPLPSHATLTHRARVKSIFDKGKNALVVIETRSYDESGEELIVNELTTFVRGAGGFGGDRGPSADVNVPPDRAPDAVIEEKIGAGQALLYRLSGDWNPLHADPGFAKAFGFDRPILHGLCTFGYAGRHVVKAFAPNGDPRFFKSIKVRFAESVFPGETLVTEMWRESGERIVFRCKVKERDKVVVSNAAIELYRAIPEAKAPSKSGAGAAEAPAQAAPSGGVEPISADVFAAIGRYVQQNAGMAAKIAIVYQFKLTSPDATWTVDLKNGEGKVEAGGAEKADCVLELTDADFMAMCTGKADAQKLYFGGKLKITGNVMASQKLEFLKKLDPAFVLEAARARSGGGAGAAIAAAPKADDAKEPAAPADGGAAARSLFQSLKERIAKTPALAGDVAAVIDFVVDGAAWSVDLKNGAGAVTEGKSRSPDATMTIASGDLVALAQGSASAQSLYQRGLLRVDGDVRAAHRLGFLKQLI